MQTAEQLHFSAEDYLAWEETQAEKHEFVAGEVFAITDIQQDHVIVSGNIAVSLKLRLRGTPYLTYAVAMKLRVEAADAFFYPDVMVSCHPEDRQAQQFLSYPTLIVEVLSDSTAAYDRGDKFAYYRRLDSLQEYVIVDIDSRRVECFRRTTDNEWLLHDYHGEGDCTFNSLSLSLPLTEVFEDIESA